MRRIITNDVVEVSVKEQSLFSSEFGTTIAGVPVIVKFRIQNVKPPRNIVGPIVRQMRDRQGLTQPMLVAKLNLLGWDISRETLAKIETQIRWVADFELVHLSQALQIDEGELLRRVNRQLKSQTRR